MNIIVLSENYHHVRMLRITEYLKTNATATYEEIARDTCINKNTIAYYMQQLSKKGIIQITERIRDKEGLFISSEKLIILQIVIEQKIETCEECGENFKKKKQNSKYQKLCHKCTQEKYMTRKRICCFLCKEELDKRESFKVAKKQLFGHEECVKKYYELKKEEQNDLKWRCKYCGKKINGKRICEECLAKNITKCKYCGDKIYVSNRSGACMDKNCRIKKLIEDDLYISSTKKSNASAPDLIREIFNNTCIVCGYNKHIEIHHILPRSEGGENRLSNIVPLCPNCHTEVHYDLIKAEDYKKKTKEILDSYMNS